MLESGSVRLRALETEDLELLARLENDESLWTVSCNSAPYSIGQLRKYIEENTHDIYADHQQRFVIECDGNAAGCIDLTEIDAIQSRAVVGIALLPEFRGRGAASTALDMLCLYARKRLRLHQLAAYVPSDNDPSRNLFVSNGFSHSGTLRDWLWNCDGYTSVEVYQKIF